MAELLLFDGDRESTVDVSITGTDAAAVTLDAAAVLASTGWEVKPYGLCRGDVCNPAKLGDTMTLAELADALRRPVAVEIAGESAVAVLGEAGGTTARTGDIAAELTLPDVNGNPVAVTGGTGRKTAVVTWSTWCGCRYELPSWQQLADELRPLGLDLVTVALDDDVDAVRKWTSRVQELPTAVDADHRVSDVLGVVNVPATVWLDEEGRVVKPPTIAPGNDQFKEFTEVGSEEHHRALREWVAGGAAPAAPEAEDTDDLRAARAERRLAAWLHRQGRTEAAEQHFVRATELAPLDFSIVRASMTSRGQDPLFGAEFLQLWEEWSEAGRPGYTTTPVAPSGSA